MSQLFLKSTLRTKKRRNSTRKRKSLQCSVLIDFDPETWFSRNSDASRFGSYNPSFKTRGQGEWHDRLRIVQSQHWGIRALNTNTFTAGWIHESHLESSLSWSRPFYCHLWSFLDGSLLAGHTMKITHWENTGKSGDPFYCLSASMTGGLTSIKLGDNLWLLFSCVSLHKKIDVLFDKSSMK